MRSRVVGQALLAILSVAVAMVLAGCPIQKSTIFSSLTRQVTKSESNAEIWADEQDAPVLLSGIPSSSFMESLGVVMHPLEPAYYPSSKSDREANVFGPLDAAGLSWLRFDLTQSSSASFRKAFAQRLREIQSAGSNGHYGRKLLGILEDDSFAYDGSRMTFESSQEQLFIELAKSSDYPAVKLHAVETLNEFNWPIGEYHRQRIARGEPLDSDRLMRKTFYGLRTTAAYNGRSCFTPGNPDVAHPDYYRQGRFDPACLRGFRRSCDLAFADFDPGMSPTSSNHPIAIEARAKGWPGFWGTYRRLAWTMCLVPDWFRKIKLIYSALLEPEAAFSTTAGLQAYLSVTADATLVGPSVLFFDLRDDGANSESWNSIQTSMLGWNEHFDDIAPDVPLGDALRSWWSALGLRGNTHVYPFVNSKRPTEGSHCLNSSGRRFSTVECVISQSMRTAPRGSGKPIWVTETGSMTSRDLDLSLKDGSASVDADKFVDVALDAGGTAKYPRCDALGDVGSYGMQISDPVMRAQHLFRYLFQHLKEGAEKVFFYAAKNTAKTVDCAVPSSEDPSRWVKFAQGGVCGKSKESSFGLIGCNNEKSVFLQSLARLRGEFLRDGTTAAPPAGVKVEVKVLNPADRGQLGSAHFIRPNGESLVLLWNRKVPSATSAEAATDPSLQLTVQVAASKRLILEFFDPTSGVPGVPAEGLNSHLVKAGVRTPRTSFTLVPEDRGEIDLGRRFILMRVRGPGI